MKLSKILENVTVHDSRSMSDVDITNITSDSRQIRKNGLFFAISGYNSDGSKFIPDAIKNGAVAIAAEEGTELSSLSVPDNIPLITVSNIRHALATASCSLYDNPSEKLTLLGITGTKGKTTSTFMTKAILEAHGLKVGLIGSIAIYIGDRQLEITDRTTPESCQIQEALAEMVKEKCDVAIIEVSSQAMKMDRVVGCHFDAALFTNLSEDHISPREHKDMEDYFSAKMMLMELAPDIVINLDNEYTARIPSLLADKKIKTFGLGEKAYDFTARALEPSNEYTDFTLCVNDIQEPVRVSMPGKYMVYNALGAIALTDSFGVTADEIRTALKDIKVLGRSELFPNKLGLTIMLDYAHTPSSLESILSTVKPYTKGRLICVWGVGGDRDKAKRPIMGEISGNLADFTILTSDQIRSENPMDILRDIEVGIRKTSGEYTIIPHRTEAIKHAIYMATPEDMIVIPGLGNDMYIEYKGVKYPYNEREIINNIIDEMMQKNISA